MCSGAAGPARRRASRTASRVAASQSSHSMSVRAAGTVPCAGQPDADDDEAAVAIAPCDVAQAVGQIGEAVQQHHGADRRSVGLEDVGAVPVLLEIAGVDRAAGEVAIAGGAASRPRACRRPLCGPRGRPRPRPSARSPNRPCRCPPPACRAARRCARAAAAPALGIIGPHGKKGRRNHDQQQQRAPEAGTTLPS